MFVRPVVMSAVSSSLRKKSVFSLYELKYSDSSKSLEMSYEKYGKPPLIVMHCLFGSKKNWITMCRALNNTLSRSVYAVDLRNHGDSPHSEVFNLEVLTGDLKLFLERLNMSKVSLLGHSLGGKVAMHFTMKYPDYVEKVIAVDISPFTSNPDRKSMYDFFDAMKAVKVDPSKSAPEGRHLARQQLLDLMQSPVIVDFLLMSFVKTESGEFKWLLNLDSLQKNFHDNILVFPEITTQCVRPTLFIVGTKSFYVPREDEDKILEVFPYAKFVYLKTGHWVHAQDPKGVVDAVVDFLRF